MDQNNHQTLHTALEALGESITDIVQSALSVEDVLLKSSKSLQFIADGENGPYGQGLQWRGSGPTKQFAYRSNPDRIWTTESIDLAPESSYMIGNTTVLRSGELGSSIRTSSLVTVGTLQNLRTQGNLSIDDYIFYNSDSESLGIGTESANGKLSIATLDSEFIIDTEPRAVKLGTWTADDLKIITDDTARLTIRANGKIDLGDPDGSDTLVSVHGKLGVGVNHVDSDVTLSTSGPVKFENKKFMVGQGIPVTGSFRQGDIVWNDTPVSTGHVGWVCTRTGVPGEWRPFGQIG